MIWQCVEDRGHVTHETVVDESKPVIIKLTQNHEIPHTDKTISSN